MTASWKFTTARVVVRYLFLRAFGIQTSLVDVIREERRTIVVANIPKVLVVDDERTVADTLALILSTHGYEIRTAYSAEQAIEIIAEWLPDLATIDVVLPRMNGIDLAILLTARCPTCRLLLFSGQWITTELLAEAATRGHKFEILAKPVHPAEILEKVSKLLT